MTKGTNPMVIWVKSIPGRGRSNCPKGQACYLRVRNGYTGACWASTRWNELSQVRQVDRSWISCSITGLDKACTLYSKCDGKILDGSIKGEWMARDQEQTQVHFSSPGEKWRLGLEEQLWIWKTDLLMNWIWGNWWGQLWFLRVGLSDWVDNGTIYSLELKTGKK